jgi:hypothetical protein
VYDEQVDWESGRLNAENCRDKGEETMEQESS